MTPFAAITKTTCATALALLLASACGGNSFSGTDEPKAGSDSGGASTTTGGSGSQAGKPHGGTPGTAGTASGGGPSAGAAGTGPGDDACNAPPVSGSCDAYFERWYHDPTTGLCRAFGYGGCGGNENNYETFEECQQACPGGTPNYDACSAPTDCVVTGIGCCGLCDSPDIRARDLLAYNRKYAGFVQQCGLEAAGAAPPGDIACAPCLNLGDSGSLKYFVPNCVQGQCVVEDIRVSAVSACKVDEECFIRNGNGCCESCIQQSIAISENGNFEQLVCGEAIPPCDPCAAAPTSEVAVCGRTGHCEILPQLVK